MRFRFPQYNEIHEISEQPIVAVDLGFANSKKSCGIAFQETRREECRVESLDFGQCVESTVKFLLENTDSVLIVEAPLSGLFDSTGNPKGRLPFEKAEGKTRYWYAGPGAAVGLGAIFFFTHLSERVNSSSSITASVIEGFVSFKTRSSDDREDARALLKDFRNSREKTYEVKAKADARPVNFLSFAGLCLPEDPCPIVMVAEV